MKRSLLPLVVAMSLVACADGADDAGEGGGDGGGATTTSGGTTTASGSTTTTGATTSTGSTTSASTTSSTGGGGEGGSGGSGSGGGPPAEYALETEPNNTPGQANALPMGAPGFAAVIDDSNDPDNFSVVAPLGATMSVAVGDGYGGCPADANVTIQILDPDDLVMSSASGLCPKLDGNSDPDLASLAQAGTYVVRVTANQPVASYAIDIVVAAPVCGDTIVQLGEECDDGNATNGDGCEDDCTVTPVCGDGSIQTGEECDDGGTTNGDGCDSLCQFEGNVCVETEANNSIAQANVGPMCTAWNGAIGAVGDVDYYAVTVGTSGSRIQAEVVDIGGVSGTCPAGYDSTLYLFNASMTELAYDDDSGLNNCSTINQSNAGASNLAAGTYYLAVHEYGDNGTSPPYQLKVNVFAPGCGDGTQQAPEECDDGNLTAGDGCSPTCTFEPGLCGESEPNDTTATADVLAACTEVLAAIPTVSDVDYFQIDIPVAGTDLRVEVLGPSSTLCPGGDPHIYLLNSMGTELGNDDDSGDGLCSLIDPTVSAYAQNLAAGTYYLRFQEHFADSTVPLSKIKFTFLP